MSLFKNGVGRPSKKTLRNRKIAYFIILCLLTIIAVRGIYYASDIIKNSVIINGSEKNAFIGNGDVATDPVTSVSDGKITNADSDYILKYSVKMFNNATTKQINMMDIDSDGKVSTEDSRIVLRLALDGIACGDINQDGKHTKEDLDLLNDFVSSKKTPTDIQKEFADINGNGSITNADALILKNVLAGYGDIVTAEDYSKGDGKINKTDAVGILKISVGLVTPTSSQKLQADINGDGKITPEDARLLLNKLDIDDTIFENINIKFEVNGADSISNKIVKCRISTNPKKQKCDVTTPTITAKSGFTVVGWSTNKNGTTSEVKAGDKVTLSTTKTYYAITKSSSPLTATFDKNRAESIEYPSQSCYRFNGSNSCNITTPTITAKTEKDVIGWSTNKNATTAEVGTSKSLSITKNVTYYALVKLSYKLIFNVNGSDGNNTTLSCEKSECNFNAPDIKAKPGFEVVGWSEDKNSKEATLNIGDEIKVNEDKTYYAITKSSYSYSAFFEAKSVGVKNIYFNASKSSSEYLYADCYRYNGDKTCKITTPYVTPNDKYNVVGWSKHQDDKYATIKQGDTIDLSTETTTYYPVYNKTITVTFDKDGADSLSFYKTTCVSYGDEGCQLTQIPIIYSKGNEVRGFTNSSNNNDFGSVISRTFYNDTTLYASINNSGRATKEKYDIYLEKSIRDKPIYFERGVSYNDAMAYYEYLYIASEKMPCLFINKAPINILTRRTMDRTQSSDAQGITYFLGPRTEFSNVDSSADQSYNGYAAASMIHELGHVADEYYATRTGDWIHNQADIKYLFNKYKNYGSSRPLRDYSYGDTGEFVADLFEYYYYYKYMSNYENPKEGRPINSELANTLEKYIRVLNQWV